MRTKLNSKEWEYILDLIDKDKTEIENMDIKKNELRNIIYNLYQNVKCEEIVFEQELEELRKIK